MTQRRAGFWCALFGALAFLLPRFGTQHVVLVRLGDAAGPVAIALILIGVALFVAGGRKRPAAAAGDSGPPKPTPSRGTARPSASRRMAGAASRVHASEAARAAEEPPMRTKLAIYAWMTVVAALLAACAAGARVGPVGGGVSAF